MGWKDIEHAIATQAIKDESFRDELLKDAKGTVEKYTEQTFPEDVTVTAHMASPKNLHLVLWEAPEADSAELSDEDLEQVAGGEFFVTAAVIGASAALGAAALGTGMTIANDQTRARHGW